MKIPFGLLPSGEQAFLYTIKNHNITAKITDFGATLVSLWVPDRWATLADVVLGHDCAADYIGDNTCMGATVGRNANRIAGACFCLNGKDYKLVANDGAHSLHSLPDGYNQRLWQVAEHREDHIVLRLRSPHLDQGFPGNATVQVTYTIESPATISVSYEAICDRDTVFNLTNHSFFNLAGHDKPERAMAQELILPARTYVPSNETSIPTGEELPVDGTAMDFRQGKAIGRDIDDVMLQLHSGYDHTFEVFTEPCAILRDPASGRIMSITTNCPGIHFYSGNYMSNEPGKGGIIYPRRGGICLETHFYPDAVHNPQWKQPVVKAGIPYRSQTRFCFSVF